MKESILLNRGYFKYNEEEYLNEEFYKIKDKLKHKLEVIILEENLNIVSFNIKLKKNKISTFVDKSIEKNILQNGDVLYHYDYNKKSNSLYIYYIKGGKKINNFIDNIKKLEVIPIQFFIMSVVRNKFRIKDKIIHILFKINNYYYYIVAEGKIIKLSFIEENKEEILKNIKMSEEYSKLYIDNNILNELLEIKKDITVINFDMIQGIYEKIRKKQKFYTRRIL